MKKTAKNLNKMVALDEFYSKFKAFITIDDEDYLKVDNDEVDAFMEYLEDILGVDK